MFKPWLNFSSSLLLKDIDRFFEIHPDYPYQSIFAVPHLRQALATYVTNRIFDASEQVNDIKQQASIPGSFSRSFEQQLQMEYWIRTGMIHVLQENADWVAQMSKHEFISTKPRKFRQT